MTSSTPDDRDAGATVAPQAEATAAAVAMQLAATRPRLAQSANPLLLQQRDVTPSCDGSLKNAQESKNRGATSVAWASVLVTVTGDVLAEVPVDEEVIRREIFLTDLEAPDEIYVALGAR